LKAHVCTAHEGDLDAKGTRATPASSAIKTKASIARDLRWSSRKDRPEEGLAKPGWSGVLS
jgi:hypothetical protein